jgi:hypothetical protein
MNGVTQSREQTQIEVAGVIQRAQIYNTRPNQQPRAQNILKPPRFVTILQAIQSGASPREGRTCYAFGGGL